MGMEVRQLINSELFNRVLEEVKRVLDEMGKEEVDVQLSIGEGEYTYVFRVNIRKVRTYPISSGRAGPPQG